MNQRIEALLEQAEIKFGTSPVDQEVCLTRSDLDKFAELIINECLAAVTKVYYKTPLELCGPLLDADAEISNLLCVKDT